MFWYSIFLEVWNNFPIIFCVVKTDFRTTMDLQGYFDLYYYCN